MTHKNHTQVFVHDTTKAKLDRLAEKIDAKSINAAIGTLVDFYEKHSGTRLSSTYPRGEYFLNQCESCGKWFYAETEIERCDNDACIRRHQAKFAEDNQEKGSAPPRADFPSPVANGYLWSRGRDD